MAGSYICARMWLPLFNYDSDYVLIGKFYIQSLHQDHATNKKKLHYNNYKLLLLETFMHLYRYFLKRHIMIEIKIDCK